MNEQKKVRFSLYCCQMFRSSFSSFVNSRYQGACGYRGGIITDSNFYCGCAIIINTF